MESFTKLHAQVHSSSGARYLQKRQKRLFLTYTSSLYHEEKGELDWISMKLLKREKQ